MAWPIGSQTMIPSFVSPTTFFFTLQGTCIVLIWQKRFINKIVYIVRDQKNSAPSWKSLVIIVDSEPNFANFFLK